MRMVARAGARSRFISLILVALLMASMVPVSVGAAGVEPAIDVVETTEWFVDPVDGSDLNDGLSWDDAFESIGMALEAANADDVINLAEGDYLGEFPFELGPDHDGVSFVGAGAGETVFDAEGLSRMFMIVDADTTFEGITFTNGSALFDLDMYGGAIESVEGQLNVVDCEFIGNYARYGGAIDCYMGALTVSGCAFDANGSEPVDVHPVAQVEAVCEEAGAVSADMSEFSITGSTFTGNFAYYGGGAVGAIYSAGVVEGCDFDANTSFGMSGTRTSVQTAGVEALQEVPTLGGIMTTLFGQSDVVGCTFTDNYVFGAPVDGYAANLMVSDSEMVANEAFIAGVFSVADPAPIFDTQVARISRASVAPASIAPSLVVSRTKVSGNVNSIVGIATVGTALEVTNTLVTDHEEMMAGILSQEIPSGLIANCTIADNGAMVGIVNMGAVPDAADVSPQIILPLEPLRVVNSIVWDGEETSVDGAIVEASDLLNEGEFLPGATVAFIDSNISEDPQFVSPATGDYRLKAGSPCIDTGVDFEGAPADDLDGLSRPVDGNDDTIEDYDMGCYEFFGNTMGRVWGENRYETAVAISADHFGTAETVVLATGRTFADGLAASGLAGVFNAPLLLTNPTALSPSVAAEIERLGASRVIITGETAAITPAVEDDLADLGVEIERIGGANRYETAALIADRIVEEDPSAGDLVFVARGDLFADALTASPVAYTNHAPVLLVRPDEMPPATVDAIETLGVSNVVVVGGTAAVSEGVAAQADALVPAPTERISGEDRYETSVNFSDWAVESGYATWNVMGVATGLDFPDALSGGAGIGTQNGTLVLTPSDSVHPAVDELLTIVGGEIVRLQLFGGVNAVDADTEAELLSYLP